MKIILINPGSLKIKNSTRNNFNRLKNVLATFRLHQNILDSIGICYNSNNV